MIGDLWSSGLSRNTTIGGGNMEDIEIVKEFYEILDDKKRLKNVLEEMEKRVEKIDETSDELLEEKDTLNSIIISLTEDEEE